MKMWIDIEEKLDDKGIQIDLMQFGIIITDNDEIKFKWESDFEQLAILKEKLLEIIEQYNVNEIFHYGGKEQTLISSEKLAKKTINFINIQDKISFEKIKNYIFAKMLEIEIDYSKLHSPLYDIELSYESYYKYLKFDEETRKSFISNANFQLTMNFRDIHKEKVNYSFINNNIINNNNFWLINQELLETKDNQIVFINYMNWEQKKFDLNSYKEIIGFYKENIVISVYGVKQQNKISELLYKIHSDKFYAFETINIAKYLINNSISKSSLFLSKEEFEENIKIVGNIIQYYNTKI